MARVLWSLVCRRAIVDEHLKLASLIDVVEAFNFSVQPGKTVDVLPLDFSVVVLWTRDDPSKPEVGQARVRVVGPNGKEGRTVTVEVDMSAHRNYRNIVVYRGLPFLGSGDYVFIIELETADEWAEHARMVLTVNEIETSVPEQ